MKGIGLCANNLGINLQYVDDFPVYLNPVIGYSGAMNARDEISVLVSTEWVADHLDDPSVRLLEVDVDTSAYDHGHLRGAYGINWTSQLCDRVRRDVLSPTEYARLCSRLGITPDTRVVFYGDSSNWFAAYAFWQFRYHGHPESRLALMDGGRSKWIAEGRPLVLDVPQTESTDYLLSGLTSSIRCRREDVFAHLANPVNNLIDVRSSAEYRGEVIAPPGMRESALRGGHIPGAINVPWADALNDDGTFKSEVELRALYESKGVDLSRPTIVYCRIGERSAHSWFLLTYLLHVPEVANYDGSWTEWGNLIAAPIERSV